MVKRLIALKTYSNPIQKRTSFKQKSAYSFSLLCFLSCGTNYKLIRMIFLVKFILGSFTSLGFLCQVFSADMKNSVHICALYRTSGSGSGSGKLVIFLSFQFDTFVTLVICNLFLKQPTLVDSVFF